MFALPTQREGEYLERTLDGERVQAFVPAPLPPAPPGRRFKFCKLRRSGCSSPLLMSAAS